MEKKTIGQFIAILRKANGMTQKDLAEKLNVSDKAVSRWERDECAPDLSLIPVIAEIFQVTTDELLRGERKNVEQTQQTPEATEEKISAKSEKQVARILSKSKTGMTVGSIVSIGIAVVGLLVALLCNFAFLKSYLGFFIGCVFFLGAGACLVIFHLLAVASIQGGEIEGMEQEFAKTKQFFTSTTLKTSFGIFLIFVATLPFAVSGNSHWGLTASSWFGKALVYELLALIPCGIFYLIFRSRTVRANYVFMSERAKAVYDNNKALRRKLYKRVGPFAAILLVLSIITLALPRELFITSKPPVITSVEEFKELMEKPIRIYETGSNAVIIENFEPTDVPYQTSTGVMVYPNTKVDAVYDYYYEEYKIKNADGITVDTFLWKNTSIHDWSVEWDGDVPAFTVIDDLTMLQADWLQELIFTFLLGADILLVLITTIRYFYKRERA